MTRYSVQPRDRTFVKSYGSVAKNMGKNIGKNYKSFNKKLQYDGNIDLLKLIFPFHLPETIYRVK